MEPKLQDHVEPIQHVPAGPEIERLNYGVSCKDIQYRTLKSRNQLIKTVVNPLLDMILACIERDGGEVEGCHQRFTVNLVVTQERDLDTVQ